MFYYLFIYIQIQEKKLKMADIVPMKLVEYNDIVEHFNKFSSFNRKSENELKEKYKQ